MKTREQAIRDLSRVVAEVNATIASLTPRESAERAWHPGGPPVAELETQIAASRLQSAA